MWESEDDVTAADARAALAAVDVAKARVAEEVGLPEWYWWLLAAAWVVLGAVNDSGPRWLAVSATLGFGIVHSVVASRRLNGRRRTDRLQVSAETAGRRVPLVIIGMLLALVALTIATGFALHADGVGHAGTAAGVFVGAIVGFGGPRILRTLRDWTRA